MNRLSDEYLGYYLPAFFFMELNTDEELFDLNKVTIETLSTFHHEYVHFLQDITTSYGLMNISHIVDIQKTINEKILSSNSSKFKLPVIIDNNDISGINLDLLSVYYGDSELKCKTFQSIDSIKTEENNLISGFEKVPSIEVTVNKGTQKFKFSFGAACLLESMAYLIEEQLFDNIIPLQFPYKTAEYICKFIYPELIKNKRNLIYLCDASLNTYHPGQFFFDVINKMKEKDFLPSDSIDIYDFLKEYKFQNNEKEFSIYDLFDYTSKIAEKQLSDYFTIPYFDSVLIWSKEIISTARKIRLNSFSFWDSIIEKETKELRRNEFIKLVKELGFPLITNKKNQYFFYHPKYDIGSKVISLKAINEIKNVLNGKQINCKMKNFCKTSPQGDFTNNKCDKSPWERANETQLCPFGQVWRMWGLINKNPEI